MRHSLFFWSYAWDFIVHWLVFLFAIHMQWFSHNFVCSKPKSVFFRRFYSWFSFSLQRNLSSLLLYSFPYYDYLFLKHHSALNLTWLFNMCSRGNLLDCRNSYKILFILFFIIYLQYFLSLRASAVVHPHCWDLPLLTMENIFLTTTFKR